ncbi:MAG TPA: hypothetical protein VEO01_02990 [Pseudonocardiaceae bacterium]|nr:hypothetical protein [Pseudonocardiaceae bacterium]
MERLFVIDDTTSVPATATNLTECGLYEHQHLEKWIIDNPAVLGDDVLIVTAQYDRWAADADGTPAKDRLDILGLDGTDRLVVVELKRAGQDRNVHLQAITYAALVSRFTLDTLAAAYHDFLTRRGVRGESLDLEGCRERLLEHAGGDLDPELLRRCGGLVS